MAINSNTYSGKQWKVYIGNESTMGTTANILNYIQLDVDDGKFPEFSPTLDFEMRSGSGRVATESAVYVSEKNIRREFTLQGRLSQSEATILIGAVTGVQPSSEKITIPTGFTPTNVDVTVGHDTTSALAINNFNFSNTVYFESPLAGESYAMTGCICSNLQISGEMNSDNGRLTYSATFVTGFKPTKGSVTMTNADAIDTNKLFMSNLDNKTIASQKEPLLQSLTITIDNPVEMLGTKDADGSPELYARGVGEFSITYDASIKYDDETSNLFESYREGTSLLFYVGETTELFTVSSVVGGITNSTLSKTGTSLVLDNILHNNSDNEINNNDYIMIDEEIMQVTAGAGVAQSGTVTGDHDGSDSATVMTDNGRSFTVDEHIGKTIKNTTDGSEGVITANGTNTITVASLTGGSDNTFQNDDVYEIVHGLGATPYTVTRGIDSQKSSHSNDTNIYRITTGTPPFATAASGSALGFAVDFNTTKITSIELDAGDVAMVNLSGKVLDDETNNIAEFLLDWTA